MSIPFLSSPPWSTRTKRAVVLLISGLILFSLWQVRDIAWLIMIAVLAGYLFQPIVEFALQHSSSSYPNSFHRTAVSSLVMVLVLVLATATVRLSDQVFEEVDSYRADLPRQFAELGFDNLLRPKELPASTQFFLGQNIGSMEGLFSILLMVAIAFYTLRDGPGFHNTVRSIIPGSYRSDIRFLLTKLSHLWRYQFRQRLFVAVIASAITYTLIWLLGMPFAIVISAWAGLMSFVIDAGTLLALLPAALVALTTPSQTIDLLDSGVLFATIIVTVLMGIETIKRRLLDRIDTITIHPVFSVMGMLIGYRLGGVSGMIVAWPMLLSFQLIAAYVWTKLFDIDVFHIPGQPPLAGPPLAPVQPPALGKPLSVQEGEIIHE